RLVAPAARRSTSPVVCATVEERSCVACSSPAPQSAGEGEPSGAAGRWRGRKATSAKPQGGDRLLSRERTSEDGRRTGGALTRRGRVISVTARGGKIVRAMRSLRKHRAHSAFRRTRSFDLRRAGATPCRLREPFA